MSEAKLIGGKIFNGEVVDPNKHAVATILGEWRDVNGNGLTRWGIAPGTPCPALVLTNHKNEVAAMIPVNAIRDVLKLTGG